MIAGVVQGFVFNIGTFISRKKIEKPILFLNLLVLFLSLNNLQSWFFEKKFLPAEYDLNYFTVPWYVLIAPMFYAFMVYYLEIEGKRFSFVKISITLFCIELITRTIVFLLVNEGVWSYEVLDNYNNIEDFVTLLYSLFLFYNAVQIVFGKERLHAYVSNYDDLRWLKWFFYLGAGVMVLWIMSIVFNTTGLVQKPYSYYPLRLGSSILIYWVGYQAFFRYVVLKDRILLRKKIRNSLRSESINRVNTNEKGEVFFKEIDAYVFTKQKFLDPYLSLDSLSKELEMSTSNLSKIMNSFAGSNFSDYINKYRIEQAKKLLYDSDFSRYTIVAIGLECGFNSKSTFYAAFKKFTNKTPNAFRSKNGS
jgi:AraC-like DNA-binding protein